MSEDVTNLQRKFTEILKGISYLGISIDRKSKKLQTQLENPKIDLASLEKIGIKISEILENLKFNSETSLLTLNQDINSINCDKSEGISKQHQTSLSNVVPSDKTINCGNISDDRTDICVSGLSLKRGLTDASHTDDECWNDTLRRTSDPERDISTENEEQGKEQDTSKKFGVGESEKKIETFDTYKPTKIHTKTEKGDANTTLSSNEESDIIETCIKSIFNEDKSADNEEESEKNTENDISTIQNTERIEDSREEDAASEEDDYRDPYSVETEKLTSDEESGGSPKRLDPYDEHSYSCASSENEDISQKTGTEEMMEIDERRIIAEDEDSSLEKTGTEIVKSGDRSEKIKMSCKNENVPEEKKSQHEDAGKKDPRIEKEDSEEMRIIDTCNGNRDEELNDEKSKIEDSGSSKVPNARNISHAIEESSDGNSKSTHKTSNSSKGIVDKGESLKKEELKHKESKTDAQKKDLARRSEEMAIAKLHEHVDEELRKKNSNTEELRNKSPEKSTKVSRIDNEKSRNETQQSNSDSKMTVDEDPVVIVGNQPVETKKENSMRSYEGNEEIIILDSDSEDMDEETSKNCSEDANSNNCIEQSKNEIEDKCEESSKDASNLHSGSSQVTENEEEYSQTAKQDPRRNIEEIIDGQSGAGIIDEDDCNEMAGKQENNEEKSVDNIPINEDKDTTPKLNSENQKSTSTKSDSDTEMSSKNSENEEESAANYITNEHNYSSSDSPPQDGSDSDETDIDRTQCIEIDQLKELKSMVSSDESKERESETVTQPEVDDDGKNETEGVEDFAKDLEKCLNDTAELEKEDEELMDVSLEEYLSDGGAQKGSQETIIYDVKPLLSEIKLENDIDIDINPLKTESSVKIEPDVPVKKEPETESDVRCLELLKEEPREDFQDEFDPVEKADQILQELIEDDSEIDSYSDCGTDLDLSDISALSFSDDRDETFSDDETRKKLREYDILECYVPLERMEISEKDAKRYSKNLNEDIDWLCDLKNLSNKRKQPTSPSFDKPRKKKTKRDSSSDADTSSTISSSDDDDDDAGGGYDSNNWNMDESVRDKLDAMLADAICNEFKSSGTSTEDSDDSDTLSSEKKKKKSEVKSGKRELSKEELQKKAWRKDALLTSKLSDSGSDKRRKKITRKYENDSDFSLESDHFDSDSDLEDMRLKNKSKLEDSHISPVKGNVPDSSDSDSDVQYVSPKKSQSTDESSQSAKKNGRRQIRSILSDRDLAIETLRAKKEEIERIERIKDHHKIIESLSQSIGSQQSDPDEPAPLILDVDEKSCQPLVQVNAVVAKKLKPHQREGIQFMWDSCYESVRRLKEHPGSGCILAHCMGLGKTLQVLALVHTLFSHEETDTKHVLVVCPLSTVNNWRKEVKFAFEDLQDKGFSVFTIAGNNKKKEAQNKYEIVKRWHLRKKALLVLGYECFENMTNDAKLDKVSANLKQRMLECLVDPGPDLVVCDEGHLIKNKTALKSLALQKIRTKRRIVLTGTPLQNNLIEYYHMVDFVKPNLLGNKTEFKTNFVNPITNGQFEDSNDEDINLMRRRTHVLHKILTKTVQRVEDTELEMYLPRMLDHAVFIQLHQVQSDLYNHFSDTTRSMPKDDKVQKNFLSDFKVFQHISTHPQLLVYLDKSRNKKRKETDTITIEEDQPVCSLEGWWKGLLPADADRKIEYGNKLVVLKAIIEECEAIGDKLLVFSQSLVEMDLIEFFLKTEGTALCRSWKKGTDYYRMDGTVLPEERSHICDNFNGQTKNNMRLLLMSTKVGGLGLNLTAANRVVIMTVNWNPSYDTQSVFRAYRFGQQKQVYVYRLISLDTMEEKVYQRSVTKLAIAHRVVDKHQITRHYKSIDLQELYSCRPNSDSERPTPIVPEDELLAKVILKHACVYKYHEHKALLADRPEDKLSEQEMAAAWEDFKNKDAFKPPVLQPDVLPSNGPSFNMAYNLGKGKFDYAAQHYYVPPAVYSTNLNTTTTTNRSIPSTSANRDTNYHRMWSYTGEENATKASPSINTPIDLTASKTLSNLSRNLSDYNKKLTTVPKRVKIYEYDPINRINPLANTRTSQNATGDSSRTLTSTVSNARAISTSPSNVRPIASTINNVRPITSTVSNVRPTSIPASNVRPTSSIVRPISTTLGNVGSTASAVRKLNLIPSAVSNVRSIPSLVRVDKSGDKRLTPTVTSDRNNASQNVVRNVASTIIRPVTSTVRSKSMVNSAQSTTSADARRNPSANGSNGRSTKLFIVKNPLNGSGGVKRKFAEDELLLRRMKENFNKAVTENTEKIDLTI